LFVDYMAVCLLFIWLFVCWLYGCLFVDYMTVCLLFIRLFVCWLCGRLFADYVAVSFITVFHILLVTFLITVNMVAWFVCFCLIL
jgi:hypothetical protein